MTDLSQVNRFEVIDLLPGADGRALVREGVSVELQLQDDGRTCKVFLRPGKPVVREPGWGEWKPAT